MIVYLKYCASTTRNQQRTLGKNHFISFVTLNIVTAVDSSSNDFELDNTLLVIFLVAYYNLSSGPWPTCKCPNLEMYVKTT